MRFVMLMYPGEQAEQGVLPDEQLLAAMTAYNEEMARAGVMLAGEGLQPSARGARVRFAGGKPTVTDGPFTEAKEILGGYWLIEVGSLEEAVAWASRCPVAGDEMIEIRQVFEAEDFGAAFTPELQAAEARLRERLAAAQPPAAAR